MSDIRNCPYADNACKWLDGEICKCDDCKFAYDICPYNKADELKAKQS